MATSSRAATGPFRVARSAAGLGLFATDIIEKGKFIIEYDGPRLSNKELEEHTGARYFFEVNSRWTIDGSPRWNTARYINHSCRPNAEPHEIRGRIKIKAKRRIQPGEEITYDYGKTYFDEFIGPHGCRCPKCAEKKSGRKAARA
ncbi:SET domain-containing protein [Terrarubrum flagellatum]|uniref:SET domain-containing protein n=1 Tax=Terrirubrum flagellatum TaxID=2895980 RepID=UPI0031454402